MLDCRRCGCHLFALVGPEEQDILRCLNPACEDYGREIPPLHVCALCGDWDFNPDFGPLWEWEEAEETGGGTGATALP